MLFLMIFLMVIYLVGKAANTAALSSMNGGAGPCKQHAWEYGEDGFLVCSRCKKHPGYDPRDQ